VPGNEVDAYSSLAEVYDEIVVDPCHAQWAGYLHEVWGWDPTPVRTVLDLGCGTGLLAAELALLGYRVVGVDSSPAMLARARERLGEDVVLAEQTLPDLTVPGVFDAAVSTFDALNYVGPDQLRTSMTAVASHLRNGGWFVFDLHTDAMMDFTAANPEVAGETAGNRFVIRSVVDLRARTCDTRIDVTRPGDGSTFAEHHRQFFHTDDAVRDAILVAGLTLVAVTDEYTHYEVDAATQRATWVARLL